MIGVLIIIVALGLVYVMGPDLTGRVVTPILGEYKNQTSCEVAGYVWVNITEQNCSEIINCTLCVDLECEDNCTECVDVVIGGECTGNITLSKEECLNISYTWTNFTEQNCSEIINCTLCVDLECEDNCTECVDVVIGGNCTGEICDPENLNLCVETNCSDAGGYWYGGECHPNECEEDNDCDSDYECSEGSCVVVAEGDEDEEEEEEESSTKVSVEESQQTPEPAPELKPEPKPELKPEPKPKIVGPLISGMSVLVEKEENITTLTVGGEKVSSALEVVEQGDKIYVKVGEEGEEEMIEIVVLPSVAKGKVSEIQNITEVVIEEEDGVAVYVVYGTKKVKLFFIIPMNEKVREMISVSDGEVVKVKGSWWGLFALDVKDDVEEVEE